MKKFKTLIIVSLLALIIPAYAHAEIIPHKIYAHANLEEGVEQAKIENGNILKFKAIEEYKLTKDTSVEKDSILTVQVKEYVVPKRGKRDGYLKINVDSYTVPSKNNEEIDVKDKNIEGKLKLTTNIDKKGIAEQTGVYVAGAALDMPGFSQIYAATKGIVKPNDGQSRLESVGTNVYNSTFLPYMEKGEELVIKEDSMVEISVKSK